MSEITQLYEQYRPKIAVSSLQKGLVLHQPLDIQSLKSATLFGDKTPYNNDGLSANTPAFTTDRMGQANRAMSFNGINDKITVPTDSSYEFSGAFTISLWLNVKTITTGAQTVFFTKYIDSNNFIEFALAHNKRPIFKIRKNGVFEASPYTGLIEENEWNFFTIRVDSTIPHIGIFKNTIRANVDNSFTLPGVSAVDLTIGSRPDGSRPLHGNIADFRIHKRRLLI